MVRVLFYTGGALLAVSAALLYLPTYFSFILAALLFIVLVFLIILHKKFHIHGLRTFLAITLIFTLYGAYTVNSTLPSAEALIGYKAEVIGTVCERPDRYEDYSVYIIKTEKIKVLYKQNQKPLDNIPQELKIRLSDVNKIKADTFDRIKVRVTFNSQEDFRVSSLSEGIYAGGYIDSLLSRMGNDRPFYACFYDLRDGMNDLIYENINYDEATVVSAVLLGDRTGLDDGFANDAKGAGISHVLVVSGMHLGIIYMILDKIFRFLKLPYRTSYLLMLGGIFALMAICGFTPSILRAGLTYFLLCVGRLFFKQADPLNSLGAAAVIILFINPFGFGNVALLLSLFSTFGLLVLCPLFYDALCKVIGKLYKVGFFTKAIALSLCQTISATLMTLPITIVVFRYVSLVSPLANLLICFAITWLTVAAFFVIILLCLPSAFKAGATIPIIVLCVLVRYIVDVTHWCASFDFATVPAGPEYLIPLGLFLLTIPTVILIRKSKYDFGFKAILYSIPFCLTLLSFALIAFLYSLTPTSTISVLEVGKGSCVIITQGDITIAVGAGDTKNDSSRITSLLTEKGRRKIDYLILPSMDKSVAGGAPELIYDLKTDHVIHPAHGDYYKKLNHISDERFVTFNKLSKINRDELRVTNIADVGTVFNNDSHSVIVYIGGDVKELMDYALSDCPILVCIDTLPKEITTDKFKEVILSGPDENIAAMEKVLNTKNIKSRSCKTEHIELELS